MSGERTREMKNFLVQLLLVAAVSFALHFAWESLHIVLYAAYDDLTGMPVTLYATLGDVAYVLGAVIMVSLLKQRVSWISEVSVSDLVGLLIIGFLIALCVEYKALLLGRWAYTDAMPIIPVLNVGLSPIMQMSILAPLSVWIAARSFVIFKK